jgi:hypothetical protein
VCVCVYICAPAGEFCEERAARTALQNICWNNCQGRGECRRGFCHCQPGFWGKDCSSSKVYAPHAAHRPVHKLRVYVYDLPWTVSALVVCCCCLPVRRLCDLITSCCCCCCCCCCLQVSYQPEYSLGWTDHDANYMAWLVFGQMFMNDTVVR